MLANTNAGGRAASLARLFAVLAALAALFSVLVACSNSEEESTEGEATTSENAGDEPRVVALDWRYEEILVDLGIEPVGIAEIGDSKLPPTLEGKISEDVESVGQAKQPNLEVIESLEPDLILASPTRHADILDTLKGIADTEAYDDSTFEAVLDSVDEIAAKVGKEDKAQEIRDRIQSKIEQASEAVEPGTRAAVIGWSKDTLYTWVRESFPGSLLEAVGYEYGYDGEKSNIESKTDVAELTGDKLPDMNLDIMYLYNDQEGFRSSPWADVVDNVVDVDQDVWSRARGTLSAEAMLDQIIEENS